MADVITDNNGAGAMPERYDFHASEARWQREWDERGTFLAADDDPREKLYVLQMFPYPSGHLHAGHIRNYVLGDAIARYWRMRGYNVMHPMGFDSFGLPAEQAAIDRNIQPRDWIATCVDSARRQFQRYGFSFDWSREVVTSEPEYYRWTQWLFLKFHEAGLVYRKDIEVNWCSAHGVLANDEVKEGGCWRCGAPVAKKKMAQWCMHTTKYAQRLLDGLNKLPGWTDAVRTMQRNWLGRSEGTNITFKVPALEGNADLMADGGAGLRARHEDTQENSGQGHPPHQGNEGLRPELAVFTTRVDTIFGVTFMAIAPDHPLAAAIAEQGGTSEKLSQFAAECARENVKFTVAEEKPKRGIYLGVDCVNPFNGEAVQVWATNYVVSDFGTGAVMAVPAHDTRDHAFALEYGLPIKQVIAPDPKTMEESGGAKDLGGAGLRARHADCTKAEDGGHGGPPHQIAQEFGGTEAAATHAVIDIATEAYTEKGVCINSGGFDGLDFKAAKAAMDTWLAQHHCGGPAVEWRLRDWNMSRQRFWGAPLPMVHCEKCGWQRVPYTELPVELPAHADYSDIRVSPLANDAHWQRTTCPACGGEARREADTMTTFMCSAWYYLRFCDPCNEHALFDRAKAEAWLPVDYYVGGKEHAVGHLLYSRFITEVLCDLGLLDLTKHDHMDAAGAVLHDEPFRRLFNQGIVYKDGAKMSKSRGNVVSADELADSYGADTARLFAFFGGPADQDLEWSTSGVEGCHRFLKRVWRLARDISAAPVLEDAHCGANCEQVMRATHIAIAGVTADIEHWRFNTAIAKLMEFLNTVERAWSQAGGEDTAGVYHYAVLTMAQLLSPFAPHIAEELWAAYGQPGLCTESEWPLFDASMLVEATVEIPVQVNGKLRGRVSIDKDAAKDDVLKLAKADEQVARWLTGKQLVKEIYVPGKMVTLVVK